MPDPLVRPPSRLYRLGGWVADRPRRVLLAALVAVAAGAAVGVPTIEALSEARFSSPGSEATRANTVLAEEFGTGSPNLVLVVEASAGTVDDPAVAADGAELTAELAAQSGVGDVHSYWTTGADTLRGADERHALVLAWVPGDVNHARDTVSALAERFAGEHGSVHVEVAGQDQVFRQVVESARSDFVRAELIVFPLAFVLLAILLRNLLAALLPLGVAVTTIVGALAFLRPLTAVTEVSTFAANLVLVMGLGLGVDYCLFLIARFREELRAGRPTREAVAVAVGAAGRTVVFGGLTVAAALAAMLLFPFPFLQSFAYGGIAVVLAGVAGALVVLPAMLALAGRRIGLGRTPSAIGGWHRVATMVMRRPGLAGGAATLVLLVLAAPLLGLRPGLPDDRILPEGAPVRATQDVIRAQFAAEETDAIRVVAPHIAEPGGADAAAYAAELSRVDGITRVDSAAGVFVDGELAEPAGPNRARYASTDAVWWSVVPSAAALADDSAALVAAVRAIDAPFPTLTGGWPSDMTDMRAALGDRLPIVLVVIMAVTFAILFLMTGSVVIPAKAVLLNLLTVSVMLGGLVWVFQEGNLAGLLGFTSTGTLEPSIPILMFCVVYALSMDYELFMMARIAEERGRGLDTTAAVATGLERSGPLITAAAAVLALSFAVYATGDVVYLKMLGIGTALAIVVDATIVRAVLVPAFMRIAGRANWWAPRPLRRLHERFGITENVEPVATVESAGLSAR